MINIALSPEERKKRDMMLSQAMAASQNRGVPRVQPMQATQGPLGMVGDRAKQEIVEQVATKAIGTTMGDPTGGTATAMVADQAKPLVRDLLMKFFNKGGYVNGPLSKMYKL